MSRKADVTFIYPGIVGCGFNSFGKSIDASWISHGLAVLSASLQREGLATCLVDLRCLSGWKEFEKRIKKNSPAIVGLTMMSVDFNPVLKSIELIKKISTTTKVIVGGPHPTLATREVAACGHIDYIILGEGEIALPKLVRDIQKKKRVKRIIQGTKPDLNKIPFADRELFGGFEIPIIPALPSPSVSIIVGRGCIYNCSFCKPAEDILFGQPVRRRSVQNVIAELKMLRDRYHFKSLMIHDDCLTEDRDWVIEFCREYQKENFRQPFVCQSRPDIICRNEDIVDLMAKAGLYMYLIGFESGNQRVLNFIRKGTTVEQNLGAAQICRRHGVRIWANYMVGLPTETKEEVTDTVAMIKAIKPDYFSPAFFTPHPGSDLYEYCQKHRLSLIKSHDQYRRNPTEPKIKGQDYQFLRQAVQDSMRVGWLDKGWRFVKRRCQKAWWQMIT